MSKKSRKLPDAINSQVLHQAKQYAQFQGYMQAVRENPMLQYNQLLLSIMQYGVQRQDRTGVGTVSLFAPSQLRFNLSKGLPLVGVKKVSFKNIVTELLWIIKGDTNTKFLKDNKCTIWDEWADENGDLGKIYGYQWRKANGIDQIKNLIQGLKTDPFSRRHIVSAWNVSELKEMALTPCHHLFQCYVTKAKEGKDLLSLHLSQRSADTFIGLPYNIASYAILTELLARAAGLRAGELIISLGDAHIYANHIDQCKEIANRMPPPMPTLKINTENTDIDNYEIADFELVGYTHLGIVKGDVAV